jgi:hypothetical protein
MDAGPEISIVMTTAELATMVDEPDVEELRLSAAARAALVTATPHPVGIPQSWFPCPVPVARELMRWGEAGEARWASADPAKAELFRAATKQVRLGLWSKGAGPPP